MQIDGFGIIKLFYSGFMSEHIFNLKGKKGEEPLT